MTFCDLLSRLALTALLLTLLPWLLDRVLGGFLKRFLERFCGQLFRIRIVLAFLAGAVLGILIFHRGAELSDWLFASACRQQLILGFAVALAVLYLWVSWVGRCGLGSVPRLTERLSWAWILALSALVLWLSVLWCCRDAVEGEPLPCVPCGGLLTALLLLVIAIAAVSYLALRHCEKRECNERWPRILTWVAVALLLGLAVRSRSCCEAAPSDCPSDCSLDLDWMNDEDFVLPPYSVFRFTVDGRVREPNDSTTYRRYRNAVYFHTEGPPLELDDYVAITVPEFPHRPHYRGYDVSLRFDENYMNKLYRETADQFFQIQVLDENENPVAGADGVASDVVTSWDEAPDAIRTPTEEAWVEVLDGLDVVDPAALPKDDLVYGRVSDPGAVGPGERHLVRVWLEDPRLTGDSRLTDPGWLAAHRVRYTSPDRRRVVLYEYDFVASRYLGLGDLLATFADSGGRWFRSVVDPGLSLAGLGAAIAPLDEDFPDGTSAVTNGDSGTIGLFLRHLLSPAGPDELTDERFAAYAGRTPGYTGDAASLSESQAGNVRQRWTAALEAFAAVDALLGLELERLPLPEQVEVTVLDRGGASVGYLIELPEAIDLSRIEIHARAPGGAGVYRPVVVPNAENTRLFVFRRGGGAVLPLADGLHTVSFVLHRVLGDRNPRYFHRDASPTEAANLVFMVPEGEFRGEGTP